MLDEEVDTAEEQTGLSALLEAHGLTADDLKTQSAPVTELEMFLQEYPKMAGLSSFPNLTALRLIDQCIEKIEGLSSCPQLEKLWIIENKVAKIEGLEATSHLQELYLYSNRISSIHALDHLTRLQVLWLADNYISSLAGLSTLIHLRQLNVARNDIASIGTALMPNTALTSLNVADNRISSFQDVAGLAKLKGLQELCLADPFWGECPVAGLCNYQTFVLYLLPQLTSLDTLLLAEETKAAASATFTKKQLYYNMRIRTLRRAAAGHVQQAKAGCKAYASQWDKLHSQLTCAAKSLERQLQSCTSDEQPVLQQQLSNLPTAMQSVATRQQMVADKLAADIAASAAALDATVSRLQMELSSGGNIRLEEGKQSDSWFASCQELLKSKLIQAGDPGGGLGIDDLQVISVAKVHNRHLRLQFEKAQNSSSEAGNNQPCTEYLFYGQHPAQPGELMHVVQHGFRTPADYSSLGLDGAVRLANNVNLADQLRLQYSIEASAAEASKDKTGTGASCKQQHVLEGQLLVCKVSLGSASQEAGGHVQLMQKPGATKLIGKDGQLSPTACLDGPQVDPKQHQGATAVYRTAVADSSSGSKQTPSQAISQHRVWYVFDHAAVLPEYLVTFRYIPQPGAPLACATTTSGFDLAVPEVDDAAIANSISQPDPLLKVCAQPLLPWLAIAQQQGQPQQIGPSTKPAAQELQAQCKVLAESVEAVCPKLQLPAVSPAVLKGVLGSQELYSLTQLSLHNCGLSSCGGLLDLLPQLQKLVLSFNRLTTLKDLTPKADHGLMSLDVSHNQIDGWTHSWLAGLTALTALDGSHNLIADTNSLQQLVRSVPQLQQLDLSRNTVQQHKAYQQHVSAALHQLQRLDGFPVTHVTGVALDDGMLRKGATQWHSDEGPVTMQPSHGQHDWHVLIHTLALETQDLHSLTGIGVASQLIAASFADNMLTALAGLHACSQLRELNLSNNLLTEIGPLATLSSLQQLDLSFNHVSSLVPLATLTGLSQLSVEGNQLTSLQGVTAMHGLLELYAAGNAIADMKEAERLSALPRLVILDLADNPLVAATEDYRLVLLYRLRHLKVLDGVPAEPAELAAARAKYSGRLTMSFLEEQLGSSCSLSTIRGLDISNLRIKDVGAVFSAGTPFTSLTELVLDSNQISSVAALGGLTGLIALKLSSNRLGDAEGPAACFAVPTEGCTSAAVDYSTSSIKGIGAFRPARQAMGALLPNLQVLHLAGNGLSSLKALQLQYTTSLRSLWVQGNELQRLDGLEGLTQLRELVADKNKLRGLELETLSTLTRLQDLRLGENLIKGVVLPPAQALGSVDDSDDLGPGGILPNLQVLGLAGNRMADVGDIDKLAVLPGLMDVTLAGNPLAKKQTYRTFLLSRCPHLDTIDQQLVTDEERSYAEAMYSIPQDAQPIDAAAGWLAAAADARQGGWPGLAVAVAPGVTGSPQRATAGKFLAQNMPAVLNYDAFAQSALNQPNSLQIGGKGQLSSMVPSVPSIQSGVLVLSGASAFGLEGSSIGTGVSGSSFGKGGSPARNACSNGRQRPDSAGKQPGSNTGSPAGRRVTGHSNSKGSPAGFPSRQVAYRGY